MDIEERLEIARNKRMARQYKEAMLDCLWILGEQPKNREAIRLATDILYTLTYREKNYILDKMLIDDPRLNSLFCQCDNCGFYWFPDITKREDQLMMSGDLGGYDKPDGKYYCAQCVTKAGSVLKSPTSGKLMSITPKPNGRDLQKAKQGAQSKALSFPEHKTIISNKKLFAAFIFKINNPPIDSNEYLKLVTDSLIPEKDPSTKFYLEILFRKGDMTAMLSRISNRSQKLVDQSLFEIFWQEFPDGVGNKLIIAKIFENSL